MRLNTRTILFFVILLVIVGAALLLLNNPVSAPDETDTAEREAVSGPLLPEGTTADSITGLRVTDNAAGSVSVDLTRAADDPTWTFVNETFADREVDQSAVDAAVSALVSLTYGDRFTEDDVAEFSLAAFGLDEPSAVIVYEGDPAGTITIGATNPTGNRYYALLDEDETTIYALPTAEVDTITALATDPPVVIPPTPTPVPQLNLSGPVFSRFNQQTVDRFILRDNADDAELILERDADTGDWVIAESSAGATGPLDQTLTEIALSSFGTLSAVDGIEDADLAPLGLDAPIYTLEASETDGPTSRLQIGAEDPTGTRYYALVNAFDTVAVIAQEDIDPVLDLIASPPLLPEPEATLEATPEATAEATPES